MQSLLAKLATIALLGAGFAFTGDLRRLAERGTRFLNATAVPTGGSNAVGAQPAPGPLPVAPAPAPTITEPPSAPPAVHRDAPLGRPVDALRLPTSTLDTVDLRSLAPGARVTVWVGSPTAMVAFDVVDPALGEVLEQSASQPGGGPQAVSRRLRLEGASSRPTRIDRGGMLRLTPLGVAYGSRPAGPAETLGPVRAIEVK
jgi:hypothetical protein